MCFSSIKRFKSLVFTLKASFFDIWMHRSQLFCHNQGIYLNQYGSSSQIETSPLICSANKWTGFCIIGTSVMKDSKRSLSIYIESLFLHVKSIICFFCFFFLSGFCFTNIQDSQDRRWRGRWRAGYLLISFLPLPPTWKTLRHYLGYCCRDLTSPHSWQPEWNIGPLVHAL